MNNQTKKFHIITIGCQMNKADSERIAAFLDNHDYEEVPTWAEASLVILTTCGVRQSAEDRVYGLVERIYRENPQARTVITGCLAQRADVKRRLAGKADLFLPINELPNLLVLLGIDSGAAAPSLTAARELSGEKYLSIAPKYRSDYTAYVPIGNGCNNFCSYCVVPYARGREVYRPAEDIIAEVERLAAGGYKEIMLIAQNVNSYRSGAYDFPKLLERLIAVPGNFWLRFSSSHPKDVSPELIRVLGSSSKVANHLHLAVQSGDDDILRAMNRNYTAAHYRDLIKQIRAARPGIAITTDVIVGFPGETEAQFQNTVRLFEDIGFVMAYTAQYSPRPGTVSWKMFDSVPAAEKARREKVLTDILARTGLADNEKYIGQEVIVLADGVDAHGRLYGKTSSYKTVFFSSELAPRKLIGRFVIVKIEAARTFGLSGTFVRLAEAD